MPDETSHDVTTPDDVTPDDGAADDGTPDDARKRSICAIFRPGDEGAVDEFEAALEGSGWTVDRHPTDDADEVGSLAATACTDGVGVVAAVGGDGALSLILDAVVDTGVAVVNVPAGTVNLTAHLMGIATPADAARAVTEGVRTTIDVGRDGDHTFHINASSGFDAAVIGDAADHSGSPLGRLRFGVEAIRRLRHDRPHHVAVDVDGKSAYRGSAMSVIVMNAGQRGSPSFDVAPDAEMDDGVLDVAIVRVDSLRGALRTVFDLALGRSVPDTRMVRARGASIDVDWGVERTTQRDGDATGKQAHLSYGIRPGGLVLVALSDRPDRKKSKPT